MAAKWLIPLVGIHANVPSNPKCDKGGSPADGRGAGQDRQANGPHPAPANRHLRWLQKEPRVCDLHGGVHGRGLGPLSPLHAHLSCRGLYFTHQNMIWSPVLYPLLAYCSASMIGWWEASHAHPAWSQLSQPFSQPTKPTRVIFCSMMQDDGEIVPGARRTSEVFFVIKLNRV